MKLRLFVCVSGLFLAGMIVNQASAGGGAHGACAACGCEDACLVCRLVEDTRKIKVNCFAAECKPFCVPCPSQRGCLNSDCVDCSKDGATCNQKKVVWFDWTAGGAQQRSAKHLMKKTAEHKVPSFKWVVEDLCDKCQEEKSKEPVPAGADLPPAPKVGAKVLYGLPVAVSTK